MHSNKKIRHNSHACMHLQWGRVMRTIKYRNMMLQVQRRAALRVMSVYRTVSTEAIQVVAGVIPFDLLVGERTAAHHKLDGDPQELRATTLEEWQHRWDNLAGKCRPDASVDHQRLKWTRRKHGQVNYHLTQFLTGHRCFNAYLHHFKQRTSAECCYCGGIDTPEHAVFECPRWHKYRFDLGVRIGMVITPDNIIDILLESVTSWGCVTRALIAIIQTKISNARRRSRTWRLGDGGVLAGKSSALPEA